MFLLDPPVGAVVVAAGSGSLLPPGAGGFISPCLASSKASPSTSSKNLEGSVPDSAGFFPLSWASSIPLSIPVSIGTDMLWMVKD